MCLTHSYIGVGREKEGRWEWGRTGKGRESKRGGGRVRKPRKSKADGL